MSKKLVDHITNCVSGIYDGFPVPDEAWKEFMEFVYEFNGYKYWGGSSELLDGIRHLEDTDPDHENNTIYLRSKLFWALRCLHWGTDNVSEEQWKEWKETQKFIRELENELG